MEGKLGGGEVRRLHIIYFITHMGRGTEHPHLIRVLHLTHTGVYLRDVKRWLGELRGKDMPQAYAWSYKRKYKTGYVWQDLLDDDLLTPLSDNEYVLKGSEIVFNSTNEKEDIGRHSYSCDEKKIIGSDVMIDQEEKFKSQQDYCKLADPPSRIFSEINEEESSSSFGSERSSLTDELFESAEIIEERKIEENIAIPSDNNKSNDTNYLWDKKDNNNTKSEANFKPGRKSFSGGVSSNALRSFFTCGGVETKDSVVMSLNRRRNVIDCDGLGRLSSVSGACCGQPEEKIKLPHCQTNVLARKSVDDDGKGSPKKQQHREYRKQGPVPSIYRAVREPNCSQCGKLFKPQKMHSHMKSCKGNNKRSCAEKSSSSSASNIPNNVNPTIYKQSAFGYFLTT